MGAAPNIIQPREYRVLQMGGPVLALPTSSRRARLNAVERIHDFTWKRRMLKWGLSAVVRTGMDAIILPKRQDPWVLRPGGSIDELLLELEASSGIRAHSAAVIWPWPAKRNRGRAYIHAFDRHGLPVAFLKVAMRVDAADDLEREATMLAHTADLNTGAVRVPALLASGTAGGVHFLAQEPLPEHVTPIQDSKYPSSFFASLGGAARRVSLQEVRRFEWWPHAREASRPYRGFFAALEDRIRSEGLEVCRVQGDCFPKNILRAGDTMWVVDWEMGSIGGPWLLDRITLQFANLLQTSQKHSEAAYLALRQDLSAFPQHVSQIGAAFAYLCRYDSVDISRLIEHWITFLGDENE